MKSLLASLTLLASLSACYALPDPSVQPDRWYEPLRAHFIPGGSGGSMGFQVNRPAYAAVFEIVPGAGASLLYPGWGSGGLSGRVFAGYNSLSNARAMNREQYHLAGGAWRSSPRFFLLIASERPLDVERFGAFGYGLHRQLGLDFASLNAYSTMERLVRLAVPDVEDETSWTTDLYVEWPDVLYDSPRARERLVALHCNGYSMYVPLDMLLAARASLCGRNDGERPNTRPGNGQDSTVAQPGARTPLPPEQSTDRQPWIAPKDRLREPLRERITRSTQLEPDDESARPRDADAPGWRAGPRIDGGRISGRGDSPRSGGSTRARPSDDSPSPKPAEPRTDPKPSAPRVEPRVEPRPAPRAEPRTAPAPSPTPRMEPSPARERPTSSGSSGCNPCELR